jgi:uncharacterized protein
LISVEEARAYYQGNEGAHDFDHVLRVLSLAERIGAAEGADMEIVRTATLLHDISRSQEIEGGGCHAQAGAKRVRQILSGWPVKKVEAIAHAVEAHRFRGSVKPKTLEAQILYDADKLDSIGAIGIARAYMMAGKLGQRLWTEVPEDASAEKNSLTAEHSAPIEFEVKLKRVKEGLFTETAKKIAEERHRFMAEFFARLEEEVKGRW